MFDNLALHAQRKIEYFVTFSEMIFFEYFLKIHGKPLPFAGPPSVILSFLGQNIPHPLPHCNAVIIWRALSSALT